MEKILEGVIVEELPLPKNPLKALNLYIFSSKGKNMIVDTGFQRPEIQQSLEEIIERHELTPENTIVYLTHLHSDHTGNAAFLQDKGFPLYMGEVDFSIVNRGTTKEEYQWKLVQESGILQGMKDEGLDIEKHPGFRFRPAKKLHLERTLQLGDTFRVGDFEFETVDLQGHTPGQMGIYEKNHKILVSGDAILAKITPNITFWGFDYGDSLGKYFVTLDRIKEMDIKYLLSSHRDRITDIPKRVQELKEHHARRLQEVMEILEKNGESTIRDVAKEMTWDITAKTWEEFPAPQKWFAAGEAHSHLEHLRAMDKVSYEEKDGVLYYKAV